VAEPLDFWTISEHLNSTYGIQRCDVNYLLTCSTSFIFDVDGNIVESECNVAVLDGGNPVLEGDIAPLGGVIAVTTATG
jgi:hypothetical protein